MNKNYQNATQRLHNIASEVADYSEKELRFELESQGVDVDGFLARLGKAAGIEQPVSSAKKPTAAERLQALASLAGTKVKSILGNSDAAGPGFPAAAFGRSGRRAGRPSSRDNQGGRSSK